MAAEQGLIGLTSYVALIAVAFLTLATAMRNSMPGLRGPPPSEDRPRSTTRRERRCSAASSV